MCYYSFFPYVLFPVSYLLSPISFFLFPFSYFLFPFPFITKRAGTSRDAECRLA